MSMVKKNSELPTHSEYMAWAEFVELTGVHPDRLTEVVEMGWVEARRTGDASHLFRSVDIYRVRKLERICCDFELPAVGGTIIVDLLQRIAILERLLHQK